MGDRIVSFFGGIIKNKYLLCSLLSVFPMTEIKGGILCAAVADINPLLAFLCCVASSIALAAILCFVCPSLLRVAERSSIIKRFTSFLTDRLDKKAEKIASKAKDRGNEKLQKIFGLFAFVAIPLPLTGVWAGALLAAILRLDFKSSFFALVSGNFVAGGIVLFVALIAGERASFVLNGFLVLASVVLLFALGKWVVDRSKKRKAEE